MTQATTLQTLIQGTSQVQNVGSPKSYKRASRINTSLLTNPHPFQPKYSSRVSTLSQHLQSPHTIRTALTQPTSFLKENPPPFLIKVTSYAPWAPHSPFAFHPLSFCATNIWHTERGGLGYKQWMY